MSNCDPHRGEVPVHGEPMYCVDRAGNVRSLKTNRVLTVYCDEKYPRVEIHGNMRKVHRVVAESHLGPQPCPTCEVHHKDFDPKNTHADNLKWMEHDRHVALHRARRLKSTQAKKATGSGLEKVGTGAQ